MWERAAASAAMREAAVNQPDLFTEAVCSLASTRDQITDRLWVTVEPAAVIACRSASLREPLQVNDSCWPYNSASSSR